MSRKKKIRSAITNIFTKYSLATEDSLNRLSFILNLYCFLVFVFFFSVSQTIFEKISGIISAVLVIVFIVVKIIIDRIYADPSPIPDKLMSFFKDPFERTKNLQVDNCRFIEGKNELLETTTLIQSNLTFLEQFKSTDYTNEKVLLFELNKRIDKRYKLYYKWNELTEGKAVLQLFLPGGKTRIGASVILPLTKLGYEKLLSASPQEQLSTLENFEKEDIELKNTNQAYFLIDILLKDKNAISEAKIKKKFSYDFNEFLKGVSLHLVLYHIAKLSSEKLLEIPQILVQPDIEKMVYWTYEQAGFVKFNGEGEPITGEYIIMNSYIYNDLLIGKDKNKCIILNKCLTLLQSYQLVQN